MLGLIGLVWFVAVPLYLLVGAVVGAVVVATPGCGGKPREEDDEAGTPADRPQDRFDGGGKDVDAFQSDGDGFVPPDSDLPDVPKPDGDGNPDTPRDGGSPDVPPPDDGSPDVPTPDGGDGSPDVPPPDGGDGGTDVGPVVPGVNFHAASFAAPVADLDPESGGHVVAYGGGAPAFVCSCATDGLADAACALRAEIPDPIAPVSYFSTPFGYAIADAAPADDGNPLDLFRISEAGGDPADAVEGSETVDVLDPLDFAPTYPRGIAAYHTAVDPRDRFFVATRNDGPLWGDAIPGTIFCFADQYGDWASMEPLLISPGLKTSALATTVLDLGAGAKTYLVALNAGAIAPDDAYTAGVSVFDPEGSPPTHIKTIPLGEVAAAPLPELPLDGTGTVAHVAIEAPAKQLARVNLVTDAVTTIALGGAVLGSVVDLAVDGPKAYLADSSGRVVFVDLAVVAVVGSFVLPAAPTALAVSGGFLYVAVGTDLIAIDPALVPIVPTE